MRIAPLFMLPQQKARADLTTVGGSEFHFTLSSAWDYFDTLTSKDRMGVRLQRPFFLRSAMRGFLQRIIENHTNPTIFMG
jgi:hypothetical protein